MRTSTKRDGRNRARKINCKWCGTEAVVHSHKAQFCSEKCNTEFNRLRTKRAPLLYDIVMAGRFERNRNKSYLTVLSQVARQFRDEDIRDRAGRKSWADPEDRV